MQTELKLQWIPAHCGIHGNETADRLAKIGGSMEQSNNQVSYPEEKTIIKALYGKKWLMNHPLYNKTDDYYNLSRTDQVIIFRLRTGHNRLRSHLYNKMKIGQTEMCPCDTAPMTAVHLLQDCPIHADIRQETWPETTQLKEKLYGDLAALRRTAAFVKAVGVDV